MAEVVLDSPSSATVTRPSRGVWVITMERKPDNRLAPDMLQLLLRRLDEVEREWRVLNEGETTNSRAGGALILASSIPKFFSNGFIPQYLSRPGFKDGGTGNCSVNIDSRTGQSLTIPSSNVSFGDNCCHKWPLGWMSMNEVLIGLPLQRGTCALLSAKIGPRYWRNVVLGRRWTSVQAKEAGFLDEVIDASSDPNKLLKRAIALAELEGPKVAQGTWGTIKDAMYHWVGVALRSQPPGRLPADEAIAFFERLRRREANL